MTRGERMVRRLAVLLSVAVCLAGCEDGLFFPDTGEPLVAGPGRDTPTAVMDQLVSAYQNKSIGLFRDLFVTDGSFRFYISPRLVETGTTRVTVTREEIDTVFQLVPAGTYFYWTLDDEIQSHTGMFAAKNNVTFNQLPLYDTFGFRWHVSAGGDTVGVEVPMEGGEIQIDVPQEGSTLVTDNYYITIESQLFYMVRDDAGKWVIQKWFDFGTTS
jgi:hypothetical protein